MTRQEYIEAVKVKIEEISPFDEPDAFIADDDSSANTVKPIISYIDKSLDEAVKNCLLTLPLTLLHADVEVESSDIDVIDSDGVGYFGINPNNRFIRFHHADLQRDITAFITSEDPIYLLQQNKHTRGGLCKPVAVVCCSPYAPDAMPGTMEIYSLKPNSTKAYVLLYINVDKKPGVVSDYPTSTPGTYQYTASQLVKSPIEDLIVLECARIVLNILKDYDGAKVCENEQAAKIQAILK